MTRTRAMLVGAIAGGVAVWAQETIQGDTVTLGIIGGGMIGGALLGLGVQWFATRR